MSPIPLGGKEGIILCMAKSRSKTSLEEAALQGSYCAGKRLVCLSASCGIRRREVQPTQGQCLYPCSVILPVSWYWLCYRMRMAISGQWMPWCREQCGLTLPSLLLSPPPVPFPNLVLTWASGNEEARQNFHEGSHTAFLWGIITALIRKKGQLFV